MATLSPDLIEAFRRDGIVVAEDAVAPAQLAALSRDFDAWLEESRGHERNYGSMIDGRPRFDLQTPGHSPDAPQLRRVKSPTEVSDAYLAAVAESRIPDMVTDLIGPKIRSHHAGGQRLPDAHPLGPRLRVQSE